MPNYTGVIGYIYDFQTLITGVAAVGGRADAGLAQSVPQARQGFRSNRIQRDRLGADGQYPPAHPSARKKLISHNQFRARL